MPRPGDEPVDLDGEVVAVGASATKLRIEGHHEDIWIPHSALHADNDWDLGNAEVGDKGNFCIKRWLAEKEGLV